MITEAFAESNKSVSARSVYLALCELASDEQSETFTASKALIAHKAGVSVKTVERLLNGFEQLNVVHVERGVINGHMKAANTYTLLPMRHSDVSMRHGRQTCSKSDKVEESGKILEKKEKTRLTTTRVSLASLDETTQCSSFDCNEFTAEEEETVNWFNIEFVELGYLPITKRSAQLDELFATHPIEDINDLLDRVAAGDPDIIIPKHKTFVRLIRENF